MISHERKIIFIHIPKTAGSSINRFYFDAKSLDWRTPDYDILYGWCPERQIHLQHATPAQLLETGLVSPEQWNSYFKFTFVRNPWDRAYSDYLWMMKDRKIHGSFKEYITKSGVFKKFLTDNSHKSYRGDHLLQQTEFLNTVGQQDFDFIGRFENFDRDIVAINKKLGIDRDFDRFEKKNTNKLEHYSLFYSGSKKRLVERHFKEDVRLLNYEFEDKKTGFSKLKNWF